MKMWKQHEQRLEVIDKKIETLLDELNTDKTIVFNQTKAKPIRHLKPIKKG